MMNFNDLGAFINFNCNNTISCIASINKIVMFCYVLASFLDTDSFILDKFLLIKKGLLLKLNVYFFLDLGKFLFIIQSLLSMFSVYKTNNSFSAANSSILTDPMTSFNIIACHITVNVSKNFSD